MAVAYRPATVALIQLLAWEHPCATGAAPKRWEKKKKNLCVQGAHREREVNSGEDFLKLATKGFVAAQAMFLVFLLITKTVYDHY